MAPLNAPKRIPPKALKPIAQEALRMVEPAARKTKLQGPAPKMLTTKLPMAQEADAATASA